jgi:hypothetical protein
VFTGRARAEDDGSKDQADRGADCVHVGLARPEWGAHDTSEAAPQQTYGGFSGC